MTLRADTQTPRPGSLRRMSGTTAPSGERQKGIIASGGPLRPVTAQVRSGASRSALARPPKLTSRRDLLGLPELSLGFGRRFDRRLDPTREDSGAHDHRFGLLAR